MLDVALESVRAAVLLGIVICLWRVGRSRLFYQTNKGWSLIVGGFALLLFGSLVDISDNFESLNYLIVIGDTEVEAFLEKFVGFLGGFVVIAAGLLLWVPSVQRLNLEIFERARAEEALLESEHALRERVADLEEAHHKLKTQGESLAHLADDLLLARDEARAADRSKSEFLATMSHELRTPLNAVIGFSEIIKDEAFGPVGNTQYRGYAVDINDCGRHLLSLINDILDLSRIESGTGLIHDDRVEIPVIVRSALKLVGQRAAQRRIVPELQLPDQLPALRADERKLKKILVNLLANAIKFTNPGGTVAFRVWCRKDSGFVFQISDTGIGVAPEDIPKALSRFGQVDSDLSRQYEGTGLGLPLTKALVEQHGGTLDFQSEVGVGTTVTVRFPAERIIPLPDNADSSDVEDGLAG